MADGFVKQIQEITAHGALSMAISLGIKLNLFETLANLSSEENPATVETISNNSNLKARYVRELLCALACGDIIEVDQSGEKFWIRKERKEIICGINRNHAFIMNLMFPSFGKVFYDIVNVFQKDGPLGMNYSSYTDFYDTMSALSRAKHKKTLIKEFIPMIGMKEKLETGILVLDVGCGNGFHLFELAPNFPKSRFIGVDLTQSAIDEANAQIKGNNHKNVEFLCLSAENLKEEWTDNFDLVFIFDACHDQCRPDLSIKEINRVLKLTGLFAMVEIDATGNCFKDKQEKGLEAALFYTISVFHCLPIGNNTKNALGLGTMWGFERGKKLLRDAGFNDIKIEKYPDYKMNCVYLAKK